MSVNLIAEQNRVQQILESVDEYCDECQYESYAELTLEDLDYIASEEQIGFDELVSILRENF